MYAKMFFTNPTNPSMQGIFSEDLMSPDKFRLVSLEHGTDWAFTYAAREIGIPDELTIHLLEQYNITSEDIPDTAYMCLMAEACLLEANNI